LLARQIPRDGNPFKKYSSSGPLKAAWAEALPVEDSANTLSQALADDEL
jgi:hypothetical protein